MFNLFKKKEKKTRGYLLVTVYETNNKYGGAIVNYIFNRNSGEFEKRKTFIPSSSDFFESFCECKGEICGIREYKKFLGKPNAQIYYVENYIEETDKELIPKAKFDRLFYVPSRMMLEVWEPQYDE